MGTDLLAPARPVQAARADRRRRGHRALRSSPACRSCRSSSSAARFLIMAAAHDRDAAEDDEAAEAAAAAPDNEPKPRLPRGASPSKMRVDPLELEVAFDLVDLVDTARGGDLLDRVKALRRKVAMETRPGHPARCAPATTSTCPARTYVIRLNGVEVGRGRCRRPARVLAHRRQPRRRCPARPTREPVFGLAAKWVPVELQRQAEMAGATVVDRVVGHHHPPRRGRPAERRRLLGREDVRLLIEMVQAARTRSSSRS